MIKTKYFLGGPGQIGIDSQINKFLKDNTFGFLDVKLSISQSFNSITNDINYCEIGLLIYDDNTDNCTKCISSGECHVCSVNFKNRFKNI